MRSMANRLPTDTFLLPGQQFCIGLPWERDELPLHGAAAQGVIPDATLDCEHPDEVDPFSGSEIGACRVVRRLSEGSARRLLAMREGAGGAMAPVVLRRIELPESAAADVRTQAEWAAGYAHPHLAQVYGCELADEGIFWVTELPSGATLAEIAAACLKLGKGVPLGLALAAVHEVALGLGELHSNGRDTHGLVSDRSVVVSFDGRAKLLDVGLFRCLAKTALWGEVLEPMQPYLAPEQLLEGRPPDPKCDVFSLGLVLYECLSGERVRRVKGFDEQVQALRSRRFLPPSTLNVALGKALDEVVLRAVSDDRSKRYPSAREFAAALKQAASGFMWRPEQRAVFVGELFGPRRQRELELQALARSAAPVEPDFDIEVQPLACDPQPVAAPLPRRVPVVQMRAVRSVRSAKRAKAPVLATVAALMLGTAAGFSAQQLTVGLDGSQRLAAALRAAPVETPAGPDAASLPPAALATGAVLGVPPAEVSSAWAEVRVEKAEASPAKKLAHGSAPKARVRAKAKPQRDEAPLPPWLAKSSKRR